MTGKCKRGNCSKTTPGVLEYFEVLKYAVTSESLLIHGDLTAALGEKEDPKQLLREVAAALKKTQPQRGLYDHMFAIQMELRKIFMDKGLDITENAKPDRAMIKSFITGALPESEYAVQAKMLVYAINHIAFAV